MRKKSISPDLKRVGVFEMNEDVPYLDSAVTTKMAPGVWEDMLPYLRDEFGDPQEPYLVGERAEEVLTTCREDLAGILGVEPENVWFTSGGTESNNWILNCHGRKGLPICSSVEHLSVVKNCKTHIDVNKDGVIDLDCLRDILELGDVSIISIQYANQETGVKQPLREIYEIAGEYGVPLHVDACMGLGVERFTLDDIGADFLTVSSHKVWGPTGVGALVSNGKYEISPYMLGGEQEYGMRPGAVNMAGIVGFLSAVTNSLRILPDATKRMKKIRALIEGEMTTLSNAVVNGGENRVPNMLSLTFPDSDASFLAASLERLYGICIGIGSPDEKGSDSRVLREMGIRLSDRKGSIRMRFDMYATKRQAEMVVAGLSFVLNEERNERGM